MKRLRASRCLAPQTHPQTNRALWWSPAESRPLAFRPNQRTSSATAASHTVPHCPLPPTTVRAAQSTEMKSTDDSVPDEDENNDISDETWGTRQRRQNSNGHRADGANSHRDNRNRDPGHGNSINTPPNLLGPGCGSNVGACNGVGAGGVGLLSSSSGANLPTEAGPSTPLKPSDNDGGKDLVAVTPGSITTQMTAQSTLFDDGAIDVRRRSALERGRSRRHSSHSLSQQYRLLRSQILLLFSSASLGLLLFLFYALPLAAFVSLGLLVMSLGALVPGKTQFVFVMLLVLVQTPTTCISPSGTVSTSFLV